MPTLLQLLMASLRRAACLLQESQVRSLLLPQSCC